MKLDDFFVHLISKKVFDSIIRMHRFFCRNHVIILRLISRILIKKNPRLVRRICILSSAWKIPELIGNSTDHFWVKALSTSRVFYEFTENIVGIFWWILCKLLGLFQTFFVHLTSQFWIHYQVPFKSISTPFKSLSLYFSSLFWVLFCNWICPVFENRAMLICIHLKLNWQFKNPITRQKQLFQSHHPLAHQLRFLST